MDKQDKQKAIDNAKKVIKEAKSKKEEVFKIEAELNAAEKVLQERKDKLIEIMKEKNINISIDEIPVYVDKLLDKVVQMTDEIDIKVKQIDDFLSVYNSANNRR